MNWKKLFLIALVAGGFAFAPAPRAEAGVSVGIGVGFPVAYPYPYPYGYPYPYYGPSVWVGPGFYWCVFLSRPFFHGRRVFFSRPFHRRF
ncbi:MAG: hypothetical protein DMF34_02840 [Verrucomicrobia bacterium]|nr:MAG: hypothetical protein DMF34_02840 [Verrucomicrobiota bacterium]